jgi:hypothetical protein
MDKVKNIAIGGILLIIAIVIIFFLFSIIRGFLGLTGGSKQAEEGTRKSEIKKIDLVGAPNKNQAVQYTISGPIKAKEEHQFLKFIIDNDSRRIEIQRGYNGEVIKAQEFDNTRQAYEAFVAALNGAGFMSNRSGEGRGDEKQSCPQGRRFAYEFAPGSNEAFRTWTTSCSRKQGTFDGNVNLVNSLFRQQIPGYNTFVSGTSLN